MAEQLGFQQAFGRAPQLIEKERPSLRADSSDVTGDASLPVSRLALDQHSALVGATLLASCFTPPGTAARCDRLDLAGALATADLLLELLVLRLEAAHLGRAAAQATISSLENGFCT